MHHAYSHYIWLFVAGFGAAIFGSMVGLGGGFIIVPVLRIFFGLHPAVAAGTSLTLVIANSGSGAVTYLLHRRVHVRTGLLVAAGGLPGGILGAIIVKNISPHLFDWLFAAFLVIVAADIGLNVETRLAGRHDESMHLVQGIPWFSGLCIGFAVGLISSMFGVGGGVVLIPSLLYFSDLPAHMISATSHFGIVLTSPTGFISHYVEHDIDWEYVIPLVLGGLLGGPIGARLSLRLRSPRLMALMAAALVIAAGALVGRHIFG